MLAAVHYHLLRNPGHQLARFYPTLTDTPADPHAAAPAFRAFVLDHRVEVTALIAERTVQTNEVRRCCYLYPAVQLVGDLAGAPISLIEAGCSAGLNLGLDRYGYHIGDTVAGDPRSPVQLECALRGEQAPPSLPAPEIAWRAGLDLNPLNPANPADRAWLEALVWPEHPQRLRRLRAALDLAARSPRPRTYTGDARHTLPTAVADAPAHTIVCVMHTAFLAHFPADARDRFEQLVPRLSTSRPVYWIHAEPRRDRTEPRLQLWVAIDGRVTETRRLAYCHAHGEWLEWIRAEGTLPVTPASR
jgi:hypothetical protein